MPLRGCLEEFFCRNNWLLYNLWFVTMTTLYLYQYQYQYAWPVQESCRVGNSFIIKEEKITYNNILPSTPFVCVANKIVILCNSTWLDRRGFLLMVKSRRIERCYKCIFLLISWICEITCRRLSSKIKQDINFLKIRLYG
jgi:hypothetical protein